MSEMGVKSIKDHNPHHISLFHGGNRWLSGKPQARSVYLRGNIQQPGVNGPAGFFCVISEFKQLNPEDSAELRL